MESKTNNFLYCNHTHTTPAETQQLIIPPMSAPAAERSRRLSREMANKAATVAADSLSIMIQKELTAYSSPCQGYLDPSDPTMITATDRKMVVDWCYGIVDHFNLSRQSVAMAMEMVDRFLDMPSFSTDAARVADGSLHSQGKFQLLAIAALYSSTKVNENHVMSSDLFAFKCGDIYTKEEIEGMEHILSGGSLLRWNYAPTAYQVGHSILSMLVPYVNIPEAAWAFLLDEMKYQTEHAVRDYYFSTQRTSTIALAAIFHAVEGIGSPEKRQEVLGALLVRVMLRFDFDHSNVISAAKNRLQRLIQSDTVDEHLSEDSMKSVGVDEQNEDWDDFMKTFDSDFDSTFDGSTNNKSPKPKSRETAPKSIPTVSPESVLMKPMRPLTPYFIYLQIEKEFIIQSIAGEDTDKSINDSKVYLDYVPERYRKTKLSPDWYFGPGKKKSGKRKHRKQRGKIGFVELSQIVAARWAKLEETDPDIKSFIQKLANQELEEYRRDMKEYKKLIKNMTSTPATTKNKSKKRVLEGRFKYEDGASQMLSESYPSSSFLSNNDDLGVKDFQYNPVTKIHGRNVE